MGGEAFLEEALLLKTLMILNKGTLVRLTILYFIPTYVRETIRLGKAAWGRVWDFGSSIQEIFVVKSTRLISFFLSVIRVSCRYFEVNF